MTEPTQPPPETVVIMVLPSGHEIRKDLLDRARSRIPTLCRDRDYALEEICGREFWRSLPKRDRIEGGITIAYMVKTRQLPLEFTTCPHAVPKRYRRI